TAVARTAAAAGRAEDPARGQRRGESLPGPRGLQPGFRRASAAAVDPARGGEPAGEDGAGRRTPARADSRGRRCRRRSQDYGEGTDRKSTRLNSSHVSISYA